MQFPPEHSEQRYRGEDCQTHDPSIFEPVFRIAFFEHVLQAANAQGQQRNAGPSHFTGALRLIRRIAQKTGDEKHRRDTDRHVDEEASVPRVVVGDPATERGPERRCHDHAEQKHRLHKALFFNRKYLSERHLRSGEQCRTTGALQNAPEHQREERDVPQKTDVTMKMMIDAVR